MKEVYRTPYLLWPLLLLAVQLPFELDTPLRELAGIAITNVEISLGLVFFSSGIAVWQSGLRWPPARYCIIGAWFIVALFASALLADTLNGNALRAALRTLSGIALTIAALQLVRTRRQLWQLLSALLLGGCLSVALGWYEVERGVALGLLDPFRVVPSIAGPFMRLTGSFDYVNQTTMYVEALLPLAVIAIMFTHAATVRRAWQSALALLSLIIICAGIVLSLSRAAWLTTVAILLLAFVWRRLTWRDWQWRWLLALACFVTLFGVSVLRYPVFALRLQTETDTEWYNITIDAPPSLTLSANETIDVTLFIENQSLRDLKSDNIVPVNIGIRWLDGDKQLTEQRFRLGELDANSAETFTVPLEAPPTAGDYLVQWDLVEENIAWFSDKTERDFFSTATVLPGEPVERPSTTFSNPRVRAEGNPPDTTRLTLWRTALSMWRDAPLFGIGLDNYRLSYGAELGQTRWNEQLHTNNFYLETLVSFGLFGTLPFFALLGLLLFDMLRGMARSDQVLTWAIALGLLTYYLHGLLDYFLLFNSTGLLFWLLIGTWFAQQRLSDSTESARLS